MSGYNNNDPMSLIKHNIHRKRILSGIYQLVTGVTKRICTQPKRRDRARRVPANVDLESIPLGLAELGDDGVPLRFRGPSYVAGEYLYPGN